MEARQSFQVTKPPPRCCGHWSRYSKRHGPHPSPHAIPSQRVPTPTSQASACHPVLLGLGHDAQSCAGDAVGASSSHSHTLPSFCASIAETPPSQKGLELAQASAANDRAVEIVGCVRQQAHAMLPKEPPGGTARRASWSRDLTRGSGERGGWRPRAELRQRMPGIRAASGPAEVQSDGSGRRSASEPGLWRM